MSEEALPGREAFDKIIAACRKAVQSYIDIPPEKEDKCLAPIFREITKSFGRPGIYVDLSNNEIRVYGPCPLGKRGDVEQLFYVRCRYLTGPEKGNLRSVLFFGKEGFLEPILVEGVWRPRYVPKQQEMNQ